MLLGEQHVGRGLRIGVREQHLPCAIRHRRVSRRRWAERSATSGPSDRTAQQRLAVRNVHENAVGRRGRRPARGRRVELEAAALLRELDKALERRSELRHRGTETETET